MKLRAAEIQIYYSYTLGCKEVYSLEKANGRGSGFRGVGHRGGWEPGIRPKTGINNLHMNKT